MRMNLGISIVDMTSKRNVTIGNETFEEKAEFHWSSKEKGVILSAFSLGYMTAPLGALVTNRYGSFLTFTVATASTGFLTILTPTILSWSTTVYLVVRVVEGVLEGLSITSVVEVLRLWSIPSERNRVFSAVPVGFSLGTMLGYPVCGTIIHLLNWRAVFHITGGISIIWSIIWFSFVGTPEKDKLISKQERRFIQAANKRYVSAQKDDAILVFVEPNTALCPTFHSISILLDQSLNYVVFVKSNVCIWICTQALEDVFSADDDYAIQASVKRNTSMERGENGRKLSLPFEPFDYSNKVTHPWRAIFKSKAAWAYWNDRFVEAWSSVFLFYCLPLYIKDIHDVDMQDIGLLCGIPHFCGIVGIVGGSILADFLRKRAILSTSNIHKFYLSFSQVVAIILLIAAAAWRNFTINIIIFSIFRLCFSLVCTSYMVIPVEMAGQYGSLIEGLGTTAYGFGAILSPVVMGLIVSNHSPLEWSIYFVILSLFNLWGAIIFYKFGSAKLQPWAMPPDGTAAHALESTCNEARYTD